MSSLRWRGLVLLMGWLVVEVNAFPHDDTRAAASQRLKRQAEQVQSTIDDKTLVCLLGAGGIDERSGNDCGPSSFLDRFPSFPQDPTSPQGLPPPHGGSPPPHGGSPPPHGGSPPPHGSPPTHQTPAPPCVCTPHWQCKDNKLIPEVTGNKLTSVLLDLRSNLGCGAPELVCCLDVNPLGLPPTPPPGTLACGQRNNLGVGNTFYGFQDQQTQFGEFPWTVAITSSRVFGSNSEPLFLSGGSLVHSQLVISVAHQLTNYTANELKVRLGDWNLETKTEAVPYQEIGVKEVVLHPAYSGNPYHYYDVVLLVLEHPAQLGATVNTACLPLNERDYLPDRCVVSGWGKKNFHDARFLEVMKVVPTPLVDHNTCQNALQGTRLGPDFILHDSFLCAGGQSEGQDSCTGDGGSPLVCPLRSDPSRYVQVGVVSWGIGCGKIGLPGVYVDVLNVGLWIDEVLGDKLGSSRSQEASREPELDLRSSFP